MGSPIWSGTAHGSAPDNQPAGSVFEVVSQKCIPVCAVKMPEKNPAAQHVSGESDCCRKNGRSDPVHEDVATVLLRWAIFGGNVAAVLRSGAAIGLVVGEAVRPRIRKIQQ